MDHMNMWRRISNTNIRADFFIHIVHLSHLSETVGGFNCPLKPVCTRRMVVGATVCLTDQTPPVKRLHGRRDAKICARGCTAVCRWVQTSYYLSPFLDGTRAVKNPLHIHRRKFTSLHVLSLCWGCPAMRSLVPTQPTTIHAWYHALLPNGLASPVTGSSVIPVLTCGLWLEYFPKPPISHLYGR